MNRKKLNLIFFILIILSFVLILTGKSVFANTYLSDFGGDRYSAIYLESGVHTFIVDGVIGADVSTKWYVNGEYSGDTDTSNFWNGYWDPDFEYNVTGNPNPTRITAKLYNNSNQLIETHEWRCHIDVTPPEISVIEITPIEETGYVNLKVDIIDNGAGFDPEGVTLFFDAVGDGWPANSLRMTFEGYMDGKHIFSASIPQGVLNVSYGYPDRSKLELSVVARDLAGNISEPYLISPQGDRWVTAINQKGKIGALFPHPIFQKPQFKVEIDSTQNPDGSVTSKIKLKNRKHFWMEIIPTVTRKNSGIVETLLPINFSDTSLTLLSRVNRRYFSENGGDIIAGNELGIFQWPPIVGSKPFAEYEVTTNVGDLVEFKGFYRGSNDQSKYVLAILDFCLPLIRAVIADNNFVKKVLTVITIADSIYQVINESIAEGKLEVGFNVFNGANIVKAMELYFEKITKEQNVINWLYEKYTEKATSLFNNEIITPSEYADCLEDSLADAKALANSFNIFLKALTFLREELNSGIIALELSYLSSTNTWSETYTLEHLKRLYTRTGVGSLDESYEAQPFSINLKENFTDHLTPLQENYDERVLVWELGKANPFVVEISNTTENGANALQTITNFWPSIELYDPNGEKIESLNLDVDDPDFGEPGNFRPEYKANDLTDVERKDIIIPPYANSLVRVLNYNLTQTGHSINNHQYYPGKYSLVYQPFIGGPRWEDVDQYGNPIALPIGPEKEISVIIVDSQKPDPPDSIDVLKVRNSLQILWSTPSQWKDEAETIPDNRDLAGYVVYRGKSAAEILSEYVQPISVRPTGKTDLDDPISLVSGPSDELQFGNTYYYAVRSVDYEGNLSDFSELVSFTLPDYAPPVLSNESVILDGHDVLKNATIALEIGEQYPLSLSLGLNSQIENIKIYIQSALVEEFTIIGEDKQLFVFNWDTSSYDEGDWTIEIKITDSFGMSQSYFFTARLQNDLPTGPIVAPRVESNSDSGFVLDNGESKTVRFVITNDGPGSTISDNGDFIVSVSDGLDIVDQRSISNNVSYEHFQPGDLQPDNGGEIVPLEHEVLRAYTTYDAGDQEIIDVTFQANTPGAHFIKYRATFAYDDVGLKWINSPITGSIFPPQDWPVYTIDINTIGTGPARIETFPELSDFGTISEQSTKEEFIYIKNDGGELLRWEIRNYPNWIIVDQDEGSTGAGLTSTVKMTADANMLYPRETSFSGQIEIQSNGGAAQYIQIEVKVTESDVYPRLYAVQDSYIANDSPDDSFGNLSYIEVGEKDGVGRIGFLQFDISGLSSNIKVESAKVYMGAYDLDSSDDDKINVRYLGDFPGHPGLWDENTVTWNDRPGVFSPIYSVSSVVASGKTVFDITVLAQQWYEGNKDNYGIGLVASQSLDGVMTKFYSSEHADQSKRPYLEITYTPIEPDFKLTVSPNPHKISSPGDGVQFEITADAIAGFTNNVTFNCFGNLPPNLDSEPTFSINPVSMGDSTVLNIDTSTSTPKGNYQFTVQGVSGSKSHNMNISLQIGNNLGPSLIIDNISELEEPSDIIKIHYTATDPNNSPLMTNSWQFSSDSTNGIDGTWYDIDPSAIGNNITKPSGIPSYLTWDTTVGDNNFDKTQDDNVWFRMKADNGIPLMSIITDYVFDGESFEGVSYNFNTGRFWTIEDYSSTGYVNQHNNDETLSISDIYNYYGANTYQTKAEDPYGIAWVSGEGNTEVFYVADRTGGEDGNSEGMLFRFEDPSYMPPNYSERVRTPTPSDWDDYKFTGLTWDGQTIWSCIENNSGNILKHSSTDYERIEEGFPSPGISPQGVTWIDDTIWSCDDGTRKIYKHNMDSTLSVAEEYQVNYDINGLTYDGKYLYSCSEGHIYKHNLIPPNSPFVFYGVFKIDNNLAPLMSNLPEQSVQEDSTNFQIIDLWSYTDDVDNLVDELQYQIVGMSDERCGIEIADNRWVNFNPVQDWNGTSDVIVQVTDGINQPVNISFNVTVTPINDPPFFSIIDPIIFDENSVFTFDLDDFSGDVDNSHDQLQYSFSGNTNISLDIDQTSHIATFSAPENWNGGPESIRLTITDPNGLSSYVDIDTTVYPVSAPRIISDEKFVVVPEGGAAEFQVNLSAQPLGPLDVTVARIKGDSDITLQSSSVLTFNESNWDQYQSISLAAIEDDDTAKGFALFELSSSGLPSIYVSVQESENDPSVSIYPSGTIDFGDTSINSAKSLPALVIQNDGGGNLSATVMVNSPYVIDPSDQTFSLESGESKTVGISFAPTEVLTYPGEVIFSTNVGNIKKSVTGRGVNIAPLINSIEDETITSGDVYISSAPSLSSGSLPVSWSLIEPLGMQIDSDTGVVTWDNPTSVDNPQIITIRCTNTTGYDEESWYLTVVPNIIFVDVNASGLNNGTSWENAFIDLQDALTAAGTGSEIWVAKGVYTPGLNRADTFQLKSGVSLLGGFKGTELSRDQRKWESNKTLLSGDINGDDIGLSNNSDNVYTVLNGADNAILDGFTITGGNSYEVDTSEAGGMINRSASPLISNCIFISNAGSKGGAIYNSSASPVMQNCRFVSNLAFVGGGGIYNDTGSVPLIKNCVFSNNSTEGKGGAVRNYWGSSATFINCTLVQNFADNEGGAFSVWADSSSYLELKNCILWDNTAESGNEIYNSGASIVLSSCNIKGGISEIANNFGGAVTDIDNQSIQQEPLFVDLYGIDNIPGSEDDNYHLGYGSPCINTGLTAGVGFDDMGAFPAVTVGSGKDFLSINEALDEIKSYPQGGSILIDSGDYDTERLQINNAPVSIIGQDKYSTKLNFINSGTYVEDSAVYIASLTLSAQTDIFDSRATIKHCIINSNNNGVFLHGNRGVSSGLIQNNLFLNNDNDAIRIYRSSNQVYILNNTISHNLGSNGSSGIYLMNTSAIDPVPPVIKNNIFANNSGYGIQEDTLFTGTIDAEVTNNLFFNNTDGDYLDHTGTPPYNGGNEINSNVINGDSDVNFNIDGDPLFVEGNPFNYHLKEGSPAIDAGDVSSIYLDEPEPNGDRINLGFYGGTIEAATSADCPLIYLDFDGDGYGNVSDSLQTCSQVPGYVEDSTDCNDANVDEYPGQIWYADEDNDGYSDGTTISNCARPVGYKLSTELIAISGDCNDANADEYPGQIWYADDDGDGYSDGTTDTSCGRPVGYKLPSELIATDGDCNDANADEIKGQMYYLDLDDDGFIDNATPIVSCTREPGYKSYSELNSLNVDNCPGLSNPDQFDLDEDGVGDSCDHVLDFYGNFNADDQLNLLDCVLALQVITGRVITNVDLGFESTGDHHIGIEDAFDCLRIVGGFKQPVIRTTQD